MQTLDSSGNEAAGFAPVAAVLLLALVVLLVLVMGFGWGMQSGWMPGMGGMPHMRGWSPPGSPPPVRSGGRVLPIALVDFAFRPSTLRVRAAEAVNLRLVNTGRITHDLYVPALGFRVIVPPGQEVVAGLPEAAPGSYEFYCTLPGHREAGMRGTLVVER